MAEKFAPVRLGTRVCFDDRWQGRVSGLEVDEDWSVFNISVSSGFLFARSSVRLPFSTVTAWSDDSVRIAADSFAAFNREVPPVGAPARPLDSGTPTSNPGTKFAGLVIRQAERRAVEVILSRGVSGLFRIPVGEVSFSGKTMTIAIPPEQLVHYYPDARITDEIHQLIADDNVTPTDDKRFIHADIVEGVLTLSGNVRVPHTRDYVIALAKRAHGIVDIRNEIHDDFAIEAELGLAISQAGLANMGKVYMRSSLGEVGVDGSVTSQRAAEDVVRAIARVSGVRNVVNRLHIAAAAARP